MEQALIELMESVFETTLENKSIEECTPKNIENWDSLAFLNLVSVIEESYGVSFYPEDISDMIDGGEKLLKVVESKVK